MLVAARPDRVVPLPGAATALVGDGKGGAFVSTRGGYFRIDLAAGTATRIDVEGQQSTDFTAIARRADGRVVLGSADGAVYTLSSDNAVSARLKIFARRLVEDHGRAQAELQTAAEGSGAAVPRTLDHEHQTRLKALRGRSGADFDKAYIADQGENHSNALTLYGDYMLWGEYEKLHALAIRMIPITEAELKDVQVLAGD